MSARETALQVLIRSRREEGWINALLKVQIARDRLDRRDAALATRLCCGVVQNRILLDFYLSQLLTGRQSKMHPALQDILRMGIYQLFFMDKIPESAAVNESVALVKKYCASVKNGPALCNAVLRSALRRKEELVQPDTLWQRYSHPQELVNLFRGYLGEACLESMLAANNAAPETVLQVNTLKITSRELAKRLETEGAQVKPHPWMADCLILGGSGNLEKLPSFQEGLFYVQDAAAKLAVLCAGMEPQECRVVDCCAAPGGKSFAAALALQGKGQIFASDLHEHRTQLIVNGANRLGISNIQVSQKDACLEQPELFGTMDVVLADVPCSGYGIIRKKPEIRYKDPDTMKELPDLQLQILRAQSKLVKPGGVLVYSTCTLVRRENEGVVEKFLKSEPEFYPEKLPLPEVFGSEERFMLRLIPGEYETDGFFICRLRRKA